LGYLAINRVHILFYIYESNYLCMHRRLRIVIIKSPVSTSFNQGSRRSRGRPASAARQAPTNTYVFVFLTHGPAAAAAAQN